MNKKGAAAGIVLVILALFLFAIFLINIASRECNSNSDCSDDQYCSTDYRCYQFPDKVLVKDRSFLGAAFILGLAIVIAAVILRYKKEKK
jgi:hypothetical protein